MADPNLRSDAYPVVPRHDGLLPAAVRRDLADLNGQYLDLALLAGLEGDPRFAWDEDVRGRLAQADATARGRVAAAPFALFDLWLPPAAPAADRVEDARRGSAPSIAPDRCLAFVHQALFMARRLVEDDPFAARLVLGLRDESQAWLVDCRLSALAELAGDPRVVRPRWGRHPRFWQVLIAAAARTSPLALEWAHCIGLSLLGAAEAPVPVPRRRGRG